MNQADKQVRNTTRKYQFKSPESHQEIVRNLLDGKFITHDDKLYLVLKEHRPFYEDFFRLSFDYELKYTTHYCHLESDRVDEKTSRNIAIFFSILGYELNNSGKNFIEELTYGYFDSEEIIEYLQNSTWSTVLQANDSLNSEYKIRKFLNTMERRNILKNNNSRYQFTSAFYYFIDFVKDLKEIVEKTGEES